jgi:SAM-dependent MidA family methyltransferase
MDFTEARNIAEQCKSGVSREEAKVLWEQVCEHPRHVVEIGTSTGGTARMLAEAAEHLTCIDPWHRNTREQAAANLAPVLHKVTMLSTMDQAILPIWDGEISLLFIDHDHSYEGTLASIKGWRRHVRGPVLLHDYGHDAYRSVERAVADAGLEVLRVVDTLAVCCYGR